jgi:hypothetical protein
MTLGRFALGSVEWLASTSLTFADVIAARIRLTAKERQKLIIESCISAHQSHLLPTSLTPSQPRPSGREEHFRTDRKIDLQIPVTGVRHCTSMPFAAKHLQLND